MTILPRETKNGTVYFIRVSLGYINGKQQTKGMTYRPEKGMSPRAIEKELNRQAVLFEEKAKQDYEQQLQREADKQEQERIQREKEENEIEYAKKHMTFQELAEEWVSLQEETHWQSLLPTPSNHPHCHASLSLNWKNLLVTAVLKR